MTDFMEKYHIEPPTCKNDGFKFKKSKCVCIKRKTRKLKPKLKVVKSLKSINAPPNSPREVKKLPSMENEPMYKMIMKTLEKKVISPPLVKQQSVKKKSSSPKQQSVKKLNPVKPKTIKKKPRKKCPKGTVKNPKTNRCIKKENFKKVKKTRKNNQDLIKALESVSQQKELSTKPPPRKRCPKGTHKNPKTGQCDPVNKPNKKISSIVVSSNTPVVQENLGNKIAFILSKSSTKFKEQKIAQSIVSFSPEINKNLVQKQKETPIGFNNANIVSSCMTWKATRVVDSPKVYVEGLGCKPYYSNEGQDALMKSLSYSRKELNFNDVIAPKQFQSNCWFNTMFMVFFISNKGRKFFKFFRQLMITGKKTDGTIIKPPRLRLAFAHLNLAIEASLSNQINVQGLDTNALITLIHKGIPPKFRTKYIRGVGKANNPLAYYKGIMYYLNTEKISLFNIDIIEDAPFQEVVNNHYKSNFIRTKKTPDMLVIDLDDKTSKKSNMDKPEILNIINPNGSVIKYKLDSVIIRDTKKKHFCALLEIGNTQCGFDGVSFRKLSKFSWKPLLNKDQVWTFEGSKWDGTSDDVLWNFNSGYQGLYYYRI